MLQQGILNPHLLSLLARVRHTNLLVIADWAFPFWPQIETVDLSLTHGIPTIPQVLDCLAPGFKVGRIWQASQFVDSNDSATRSRFEERFAAFAGASLDRLDHDAFKLLAPKAIGLIRTGDPTPYGNVILESA
jgi:D-ribose pyranase